ncbi:TIGR03016 family PEP-CTERM system-associated outer membrane protein [Paucibacter soli]|uniref:TIGR03016 family PEP-CTERM system-associated outer membrane protein n=1 Tax=Paucibacter soli TaxID=3133433 RepID=UPI0030A44ED3
MTMQPRPLELLQLTRAAPSSAASAGGVWLLCLGLLAGGCAIAQTEASGPARSGMRVEPRLSVSEMYTDNLLLDDALRDRALVTTLAPGVSVAMNSARTRLVLDYSLNGLLYTKTERKNRTQNALSANASVTLVDDWLSVDTRAQVGQQALSAFGAVGSNNALVNQNQAETATASVTPIMRGQLLGLLRYDLRGTVSETRTRNNLVGDGSGRSASLRVDSLAAAGSPLSWYLSSQVQRNTIKLGRSNQTSNQTAGLRWHPDVDWTLGALVGAERSDLGSVRQTAGTTYGADLSWLPTPRTNVLLNWQHHVYGDSHSLSFDHRMARSAFRLSDTTSASAGGVIGAGGQLTNYELLFQQFASIQPDPVKRDELVKAFLQANGLAADAFVGSGFVSNAATRSRRQEASFSWTGIRTSLIASVNQSRSVRLGPQPGQPDDLVSSGLIKQQGASLSLSHRLAAQASASLTASYLRTRGDLASQSTSLKSLMANWNARLGHRLTGQLGLRRAQFYSLSKPYRENALFVTLVQQF